MGADLGFRYKGCLFAASVFQKDKVQEIVGPWGGSVIMMVMVDKHQVLLASYVPGSVLCGCLFNLHSNCWNSLIMLCIPLPLFLYTGKMCPWVLCSQIQLTVDTWKILENTWKSPIWAERIQTILLFLVLKQYSTTTVCIEWTIHWVSQGVCGMSWGW